MNVESKINSGFLIRSDIKNNDVENVKKIVASTGFFSENEIMIAAELIDEALKKGEMSGYHFIFLEMDKETVGYACFGPIPATEFSYDLYWIAVHKEYQNMGLGRILIVETEKAIQKMGGRRIYIETSGRVQYVSTRNFYIGCGYKEEAVMEDFYSPGDPKYIYLKVI